MADFYTKMAATASRLLTDKGASVTFTYTAGATFDPVAGTYSGGTITTFTGYGAAFGYETSEIDGTVIKAGDIKLILEATSTEPLPDYVCTVDSTDYRVLNVIKSKPAGTVTHYTVQLRK